MLNYTLIGRFLKPVSLSAVCLCLSLSVFAQENCQNGIDDDGDGLIDLNDSEDCSCGGIISDVVGNVIANPSFEEMDCCPDLVSQVYCASDWEQATIATSDYFNSCGFNLPWIPYPYPDGEGAIGCIIEPYAVLPGESPYGNIHYFEYIGTCLLEALLEGESYTLKFKTSASVFEGDGVEVSDLVPFDLTIFGNTTCPSFPLETLECPEPLGWYPMGFITYTPVENWIGLEIDFIAPAETESIIFGSGCTGDQANSVDDGFPYYGFDDLVLIHHQLIKNISTSGGNCIDDLILTAIESDSLNYQWYHEGVALPGETESTLNLGISGYSEGLYQVQLTHTENNSCLITEINISNNLNSAVDFETNIQIGCEPLNVNLTNLSPPFFDGEFQWEINSGIYEDTDLNITLSNPGLYSVTLTGTTEDGCESSLTKEDYIEVHNISNPQISFIQLNECAPYNVLFQETAIDDELEYLWDFDLDTPWTEAVPIIEFSNPGSKKAILEVQNTFGCTSSDTLLFDLIDNPPSLNLSGPQYICRSGSSDTLRANFYEGTVFWSQGETTPFLEIFEPGTYSVILTREDGCSTLDSITVEPLEKPSIITSNKEGCLGEQVQLFAQSNVQDVRWVNISNTQVAYVSQEGVYLAQAENECGISTTEAVVTFKDCSCPVYIPNAFSPNGDGVNDIFKPELNCPLQFYELRILNRWGNEVYFSNDPQKGWNGSSENGGQYFGPSQVYNYILKYDNGKKAIGQRNEIHGSFLLLR